MKWFEIKREIRKDLLSRNLKTPKRRLNELDNLENLFRKHFREYIENPKTMFNSIDKDEFKNKVAKFKSTGKINAAESSLINEIYKQIKK
jgi:DNA-binding MurR/RpiR family transcriptional regulator